MNSKIIDKITKLSLSKNNDYYAIHGTSFELIENLVFTGKISNGGNFDNYFYLLVNFLIDPQYFNLYRLKNIFQPRSPIRFFFILSFVSLFYSELT